jgi:hypothetical protein
MPKRSATMRCEPRLRTRRTHPIGLGHLGKPNTHVTPCARRLASAHPIGAANGDWSTERESGEVAIGRQAGRSSGGPQRWADWGGASARLGATLCVQAARTRSWPMVHRPGLTVLVPSGGAPVAGYSAKKGPVCRSQSQEVLNLLRALSDISRNVFTMPSYAIFPS